MGWAGGQGGYPVYIYNLIHFEGDMVVYQIGPQLQRLQRTKKGADGDEQEERG